MSYNPYSNYTKKQEIQAVKDKERDARLARERSHICDGVAVERVSTSKMRRMIKDTKGQGINFTDPLAGWETVLSDKSEAPELRMTHGKGIDKGVYYYK